MKLILISCFLIVSVFFLYNLNISNELSSNQEKTENLTPKVQPEDDRIIINEFLETTSPLEKCLNPTRNCQSTSAEIIKLAKSLAKGKSQYDAAVSIFNYLKSTIRYPHPMYYNTHFGALRTLHNKLGNCCDQTHLVNAMMRAVGIPAVYKHGNCYFKISKKVFGHVWSNVFINGKWWVVDTTSSRNTFGNAISWSLVSLKQTTCELEF